MNHMSKGEKMLQKTAMLLLMMSVSVFALGQHKTSSAPKSAPAPKAAPAQHSAPPKSSAPSHSSAPGGQQHGAPSNNQRGNTTGGQHGNTANGQRGGNTTGNQRGGNTANANGQRGGTNANGQRGGNNTAGGQHNNNSTGGQHGAAANNRGGNNNNQNNRGQNGKGGNNNNTNARGGGNGKPGPGGNRGSRTPPGKQVSLKGGGSAHIRPNGQIRSVNRNGMHIERSVHGQRRVVSTRNGVRVVANGRRGGYVQRAYVVRGGRSYYSRTYYYHGAYRAGVYRGYYYGGRPYYGYYPAYYYRPAYYGWAYNPWPAPIAYGWGWGGSPWYGYYGAYYNPYPVYPSAAFWLTDFVIAASLQAAYEADANAQLLEPSTGYGTLVASLMPMLPADAAAQVKMTPEVKQKLADELKMMLASEQADAEKPKSAASSGGAQTESKEPPPALDPKIDTFMVTSDMNLTVDGDDCDLSEGDVIQRTSTTPDADQNIDVKVLAAKKNDCAVGKEGSVALDDMQEMYNGLREQLKDGMAELAKKNGTGGLPKAPDTTTTAGDVPAPEPDKSVEKTLQQEQADADKTEADVKAEAGSGGNQ